MSYNFLNKACGGNVNPDTLVEFAKAMHEYESFMVGMRSLLSHPLVRLGPLHPAKPKENNTQTLNDVVGNWVDDKTIASAATLVIVSTEYWNDGMITNDTFIQNLKQVQDWVLKTLPKV